MKKLTDLKQNWINLDVSRVTETESRLNLFMFGEQQLSFALNLCPFRFRFEDSQHVTDFDDYWYDWFDVDCKDIWDNGRGAFRRGNWQSQLQTYQLQTYHNYGRNSKNFHLSL